MSQIEIKSQGDFARLRRLALASQGLLRAQPFGRGISGAVKAIKHLGYVQIDTISVVERAHNHVVWSRVPNFEAVMMNKMLVNRDIFEYWSHAAAFLPIEDYRYSLPYKHAIQNGQVHWYKNPDKKLMKKLLERIRMDGPLRSRDLESNADKRTGWWDLKPTKKALEQLFMEGDLMVSNRDGFQKTYDLTERILPSNIDASLPNVDEFAEHLVEQQLRCHGLVSLKGFTYLRKNAELRQSVKSLINEKLKQQSLVQIMLPSGDVFYCRGEDFERSSARLNNRMSILSPFDNSVIQRDRLKSLFQFDYQIECYVPAAKRQFGYFSLPLMYRAEFIGRMDCKAHRKDARLEILSLHIEQQGFDDSEIMKAFVEAMTEFMAFQKCDSISLVDVYPGRLTKPFKNVLANLHELR